MISSSDYLDMTPAEREAWWEWYKTHRRRKRRYSGPKGVPIPGIGKRRRFCFHRRGRRMQPYLRPRKGGGKSRRNADW